MKKKKEHQKFNKKFKKEKEEASKGYLPRRLNIFVRNVTRNRAAIVVTN